MATDKAALEKQLIDLEQERIKTILQLGRIEGAILMAKKILSTDAQSKEALKEETTPVSAPT